MDCQDRSINSLSHPAQVSCSYTSTSSSYTHQIIPVTTTPWTSLLHSSRREETYQWRPVLPKRTLACTATTCETLPSLRQHPRRRLLSLRCRIRRCVLRDLFLHPQHCSRKLILLTHALVSVSHCTQRHHSVHPCDPSRLDAPHRSLQDLHSRLLSRWKSSNCHKPTYQSSRNHQGRCGVVPSHGHDAFRSNEASVAEIQELFRPR